MISAPSSSEGGGGLSCRRAIAHRGRWLGEILSIGGEACESHTGPRDAALQRRVGRDCSLVIASQPEAGKEGLLVGPAGPAEMTFRRAPITGSPVAQSLHLAQQSIEKAPTRHRGPHNSSRPSSPTQSTTCAGDTSARSLAPHSRSLARNSHPYLLASVASTQAQRRPATPRGLTGHIPSAGKMVSPCPYTAKMGERDGWIVQGEVPAAGQLPPAAATGPAYRLRMICLCRT